MKGRRFLFDSVRCLLPAAIGLLFSGCALIRGPLTQVDFPDATINGKNAQLVLDTGSDGAFLMSTGTDRLSIKYQPLKNFYVNTPQGAVDLTEPIQIRVGGAKLAGKIEVWDWPWYVTLYSKWILNEKMDGAIGWPLVRDNILVFDPMQRTVSAVATLPDVTTGWLKLKIHPAGQLSVEIPQPDGKVELYVIDTGWASGVVLPSIDWGKWRAANPQAESSTRLSTMYGGNVNFVDFYWASDVSLGSLTLTDVPVEENKSKLLGVYDGVLGIYALARMDLIIDAIGGYAYMRPKAPPGPPVPDLSLKRPDGLGILAQSTNNGNWTVAANVRVNSVPFILANAQFEIDAGDYDGAIVAFNQVIELDPQNVEAYNLRGVIKYSHKGDADGALADLSRAIELNQTYVLAYSNRAKIEFNNHKFDQAIADYDRLIEFDSQNIDVFTHRGEAKNQQGDHAGAIADYDQVIKLDPKNFTAFNERGNARNDKHDYDGAIADFSKALEIDPGNVATINNRGIAHYFKGDLDGAIVDFSQAIKLNPQTVVAYLNRANAKFSKHDYDGAVADYDQVLELDPKNTQAQANRDKAKLHQGP
jgi:tetratricopeptide (TPR) repeat protein